MTPLETPAQLQTELQSLQACLRRLERAWPRRARASSAGRAALSSAEGTLAPMPSQLGRYQLLRLLGAGGFGLVYLAWDPHLRREVAVKVPRPEALLTPRGRERIVREAQTAAGLDHPNLVPVYEAGEAGPAVYLVSAYCPGPTLEQWLNDHPAPVPLRVAAELLACLADAVQYMHTHSILHRDLKPANILLPGDRGQKTEDRRQKTEDRGQRTEHSADARVGGAPLSSVFCPLSSPRITDFGLAKDLQRETQLTRSGAAVGTPAYMAPEQAEGRAADVGPATDVYALGVILYRVLTGRVPFLGANAVDTVRQIVTQEPLEPRRLRPEVPRDLQTICLQCLRKEPARRYATAGELAEDLHRFLRGEPVRARPLSAPQRAWAWARRRPAAAALIGVSAAALLGLQLGVWWHLHRLGQGNAELAGALERATAGETKARSEQQRAEEQARLARRHAYVTQIRFADEAQQGGQPWRAAEILDRLRPRPGEPDPRGLEWYELWRRCRHEALYLPGHSLDVRALAFTPDGRTLVSASADGTIKLWDPGTGRLRATLLEGPAGGWGLALFPDGRTLASTTASDDLIRRWDLATGQHLEPFARHGPIVGRVGVSPDGRRLASWGEDETLRLWDCGDGRELFRWHVAKRQAFAFSGDGRRLAACDRGPVLVWDVTSGRQEMALDAPGRGLSLAFAPDGHTLACGRVDGTIHVWDLATGRVRQTLTGHARNVVAVAFTTDGRWLISGSSDKTVRLWEAATGREHRRLTHPAPVGGLAISPDDRTIAVGGGKPYVIALHPRTPAPAPAPPAVSPLKIGALAFAPDSHTLASGGSPLRLPLWDPATGQVRGHLPPLWTAVRVLAYAPDGRTLAAGTEAGTVMLCDLAAGRWRATLKGHEARILAVAFAPDGKTVASASEDKTVRLWDPVTGRLRSTLKHTDEVTALAFTPDGRTLASGSNDCTVRLWDPATGQLQNTLNNTHGLGAVTFGPGGTLLATGDGAGSVKLWDFPSGRLRARFTGHERGVKAVAFAPDGRTLASAGIDKTIKLWDVATELELLTLTGHTGEVNAVAFSPDGKVLASASHDGTVRFWRPAEIPSPP